MGKPGSQRQKEYLRRLKEKNNEDYLEKERKRKREKLAHLKHQNPVKYQAKLKKDRERKRLARATLNEEVQTFSII